MNEPGYWQKNTAYLHKKYCKFKGYIYYLFHLAKALQVRKVKKKHSGIQLKLSEILKVKECLDSFENCRFLVFGLGNDSPFWNEINAHGSTLFLEDYSPWFDKITRAYPKLEARMVKYHHNITRWKELIEQPEKLLLKLPSGLEPGSKWDVILVDGPRGHVQSEEIPGRMSSIYMASQWVAHEGFVLVHDAQRIVEASYANRYLGEDNLIGKVGGRALLKIYKP